MDVNVDMYHAKVKQVYKCFKAIVLFIESLQSLLKAWKSIQYFIVEWLFCVISLMWM